MYILILQRYNLYIFYLLKNVFIFRDQNMSVFALYHQSNNGIILQLFNLYILYLFKDIFENTTGVIRSRRAKKDRQRNDQKKKDKRINNDLQNTIQKTKDLHCVYLNSKEEKLT